MPNCNMPRFNPSILRHSGGGLISQCWITYKKYKKSPFYKINGSLIVAASSGFALFWPLGLTVSPGSLGYRQPDSKLHITYQNSQNFVALSSGKVKKNCFYTPQSRFHVSVRSMRPPIGRLAVGLVPTTLFVPSACTEGGTLRCDCMTIRALVRSLENSVLAFDFRKEKVLK
jgi:hypothetical protein